MVNREEQPADERLETWKRIANHLNRTVRTARRWEKLEGLPVHRHQHRKSGTVFAYRFELDAWSASRESQSEPSRQTAGAGSRRGVRHWSLVLLAFVLSATAIGLWRYVVPPGKTVPDRAMLAVLPFDDLGTDPDQEYFSDGMTEQIIAELGQLRPDLLGVIARTSVMQYKQSTKSARRIGSELGVDYLLEGSVRREGPRVRVTVQLVSVDDETQLWSANYDRQLGAILSLQADIARSVAQAIHLKLVSGPMPDRVSARLTDPDAYEAYLKGRFFWGKRTPDALRKARDLLERAVQLDPELAAAHADLAGVLSMLPYYGVLAAPEAYIRAQAAVFRALEIDPDLASAHAVLGTVRERLERDWAGADESFRRAIELDPNFATGYHWYGLFLERMGRLEEAEYAMAKALELDPVSIIINKNAADPHFYSGDHDRAIEQYRNTLEMNPDFTEARLFLGLSLEQKSRLIEAIAEFRRAGARIERPAVLGALGHAYARAGRIADARFVLDELTRSERYVDPYHIAVIHVGLDDHDHAFQWLDDAMDQSSEWLLHVRIDPRLRPLHADPRYRELLQRMNLADGS
jgi:TolB-like protein/tetratricopeptide (TPR) repeat protein